MDIRKWLTSAKPKEGTAKTESNADRPKNTIGKQNEKTSKKRCIIESDSDDEEPIPQKGKKETKKSPTKNGDVKSKFNSSKSVVKEVSAKDFFGSEPISISKKPTGSLKKKSDDVDLHEDKDFKATLKQLNSTKKIEENKVKKDEVKAPKEEKKIKEETKASTKRKAKLSSESPKMVITPNPKKQEKTPPAKQTEKPAAKKPRGGGSANYASYLHREGPRALGSKQIPEGEADCLRGLTFLITGVLESMERDEAKSIVEKYGGKVMSTLSKNTKYMVVGRDAGSSKLEKAEKLGTNQIDEDGLLELIRTLPGKGPIKNSSSTKSPKNSLESSFLEDDDDDLFLDDSLLADKDVNMNDQPVSPAKRAEKDLPKSVLKDSPKSVLKDSPKSALKDSPKKVPKDSPKTVLKDSPNRAPKDSPKIIPKDSPKKLETETERIMWVDKYKPTSYKKVIGQQNMADKLLKWLTHWRRNRNMGKKPGGHWNDDGSGFKAALLSGPPGVGKTTTAQLVCKEVGYDFFELNASDTRSKKSLQQMVSQLLGNQTLGDCFKADEVGKVSSNHVIIMDEVDGMAGNEDRGGMMELISFIKASKVPIICICNDRNHPKIRSLSNHCFDLRFQRPRVENIKGAMMSIAFKEKIKVSPEALDDLIKASNQDLRQILHNMSMWSAKSKNMTSDQTKKDISYGTKHIKMNPFDVLREVFAIGNNPKATIKDKSDLFFHDYSIVPLFVQENYVYVQPTETKSGTQKHMDLLSAAADSICMGDLIDRQIRSQSSWSLLPTQAIFASVVPGNQLKGHMRQMINFPVWLGKNSNRSKMDRILQELHVHMRMRITGNKTDVALDYLPLLKHALTKPLLQKEQEGVPEVLRVMEDYYLLREDFDSILDLSLWPQQVDPRSKIAPKVKSAFTRAYNKECTKNPYAISNVKKKKRGATELEEGEGEESEEEEDNDDLEKDAMIKVKKPTKKSATESSEPSTSRGGKKKNQPSKRGAKTK